jgi:hypothetical protein
MDLNYFFEFLYIRPPLYNTQCSFLFGKKKLKKAFDKKKTAAEFKQEIVLRV